MAKLMYNILRLIGTTLIEMAAQCNKCFEVIREATKQIKQVIDHITQLNSTKQEWTTMFERKTYEYQSIGLINYNISSDIQQKSKDVETMKDNTQNILQEEARFYNRLMQMTYDNIIEANISTMSTTLDGIQDIVKHEQQIFETAYPNYQEQEFWLNQLSHQIDLLNINNIKQQQIRQNEKCGYYNEKFEQFNDNTNKIDGIIDQIKNLINIVDPQKYQETAILDEFNTQIKQLENDASQLQDTCEIIDSQVSKLVKLESMNQIVEIAESIIQQLASANNQLQQVCRDLQNQSNNTEQQIKQKFSLYINHGDQQTLNNLLSHRYNQVKQDMQYVEENIKDMEYKKMNQIPFRQTDTQNMLDDTQQQLGNAPCQNLEFTSQRMSTNLNDLQLECQRWIESKKCYQDQLQEELEKVQQQNIATKGQIQEFIRQIENLDDVDNLNESDRNIFNDLVNRYKI